MAITVADLQARLHLDDRQFTRGMRSAHGHFQRTGREASKFSRGVAAGSGIFHGFGRTIAFASGTFLGAAGLTAVIHSAVAEMSEQQKVAAQTNAVLKSTGGAANVSAKQVDALAASLLNKSGVDDEVIKSGENMLLTFRGIHNEVGRGNDIFTQATKATLDLSVAMGKDMQSSAILVGKALQDPVRGMTALRRVGVSLNKSQEETVKRLVESGHTMQAQKIILGELRKEFGGSAKAAGTTFAGQLNILKETFRNSAAEVALRFMPLITRLARTVLPLVERGLNFVADALGGFADSANRHGAQISSFFHDRVAPAFQALADAFTKNVLPSLRQLGGALRDLMPFIRNIVIPLLIGVGKAILTTLVIALKIVTPLIVTLARFLGFLGQKARPLRGTFEKVGYVIGFVFTGSVFKAIRAILRLFHPVEEAGALVVEFAGRFREVSSTIVSVLRSLIPRVADRITTIVNIVRGLPGRAARGVLAMAGALKGAIVGLFRRVIGWTEGVLGIHSPSTVFFGIGQNMIRGMIHGVGSMAGALKNYVTRTASAAFSRIAGGFGSGSLSGAQGAQARLGGLVEQVRNAVSWAHSHGWHGVVTSGFRTYAQQAALYARYLAGGPLAARPGTSMHERGMAVDVTDPAGFARALAGAPAWAKLYNHLGARDPVHFSVTGYDKGGFLPPGLSLAYNGLGRPEPVGFGGTTYNFNGPVLDGEKLLRFIRTQEQRNGRRNGGR